MVELLRNWPRDEPVPAITLRQPWAHAVMYFEKVVENRSRWPFKHRGPLIIHASKSTPYSDDIEAFVKHARADGVEQEDLKMFADGSYPLWLPLGKIVGVANLIEVFGPNDELPQDHPITGSPWAIDGPNYWLHLADVEPVRPVPFKGFVGMFKVPYDTAVSLELLEDVAEYWAE